MCKARSKPRCSVRRGPNIGILYDMTYCITIDQEFAVVNDLSLVQVSTLAAFMTLPIWAKVVAIDGYVWYQYSDEKMAEDFPLLFGVPKRCYKNISELAEMGFVELTKLGRIKYVRFTDKCADWNKEKELVRNRTNGPKMDQEKSENGPKCHENSPKTDRYNIDYNISNIKDTNDKAADGGLFPASEIEKISRPRKTSESLCLFEHSVYFDFEKFSSEFSAPDFNGIDIAYYYHAVADWSAQKGKRMRDWIATARNFIRSDIERGKLHRIDNNGALSPDALKYLRDMA